LTRAWWALLLGDLEVPMDRDQGGEAAQLTSKAVGAAERFGRERC